MALFQISELILTNMVPINLSTIRRQIGERPDARKIFILSEGTQTEPGFLEKVLTNASYIKNDTVTFIKVNKTENDKGVTDFDGLLRLANSVIDNKDNHFNKKKDKVMLVFDLDVYYSKGNIDYIKQKIVENSKYIIFVFANPAIELFLLLCWSEDAYEKYVAPNLIAIINNDWVKSDDGKQRRFVADLFIKTTGVDSKISTADFTLLAENIQKGINQENMYVSQKIGAGKDKLISNFGRVLEKIKNNTFDYIDYIL